MVYILETIPLHIPRIPTLLRISRVEFSLEEINIYVDLFKEFRDVFTWSYEEMPGTYPSTAQHEIKTYENTKLVHQNL